MNSLKTVLDAISPVDFGLKDQIIDHLNDLTKPQGSLGKLEEAALQYSLVHQTTDPKVGKKLIYTFAGDHGVVEQGVSLFPAEVTPQMVANMAMGGAAINVLGRHAGAETRVVDIGVKVPTTDFKGVIQRKVKSGTDNIMKGPAMTLEEAEKAILVGVEMAEIAAKEDVVLLGTGEMGIGNTTPSSAIFSTLLNVPVEAITGPGTGLNAEGVQKKIKTIKKVLEVNQDRLIDPLNIMAAIGGLEIAAICGLILGAAKEKIPVVIDGFISSAAALVAYHFNKDVKGYLFFSHLSKEQGHKVFIEKFEAQPLLDLELRLGEGTGAALAMTLIDASIKIFNEMATFSSAGVSQ